jgi:opacity protein-like surface antigen
MKRSSLAMLGHMGGFHRTARAETRRRSIASTGVALLAACLMDAPAAAQSDSGSRDDNYFVAGPMLGVAGTVSSSIDGNAPTGDAAQLTFGGGVAYMVPLQRYFALGARLAIQWWRSSGADRDLHADRNVTGDLALVPQARWPLTRDVELYVSLPIGVSLDFLNEYHFDTPNGGSSDADPAFGLALSILAGVRFALGDSFGVLVEAGYARHSFSHDLTLQIRSFGVSERSIRNLDIDLEQLALSAGAWF